MRPMPSPLPPGHTPVFSPRLDELLQEIDAGRAPNGGRFCGYCYTPLARDRQACPHCGYTTAEWPPVGNIPRQVFDLFDRMRRREGYVVHSLAAVGILLAFALSFVLFYRLPHMPWLILDGVVLIALTLTLPKLTGGWLGDELGAAWAQRRLASEWQEFEAGRAAATRRQPARGGSRRARKRTGKRVEAAPSTPAAEEAQEAGEATAAGLADDPHGR